MKHHFVSLVLISALFLVGGQVYGQSKSGTGVMQGNGGGWNHGSGPSIEHHGSGGFNHDNGFSFSWGNSHDHDGDRGHSGHDRNYFGIYGTFGWPYYYGNSNLYWPYFSYPYGSYVIEPHGYYSPYPYSEYSYGGGTYAPSAPPPNYAVPNYVSPTPATPAPAPAAKKFETLGRDWAQDLRRDIVTWNQFVAYVKENLIKASAVDRDEFRHGFTENYGQNGDAALALALKQAQQGIPHVSNTSGV